MATGNLEVIMSARADDAFKDFQTKILEQITNALAIPYEQLAGEQAQVTASQLRFSILERWRNLASTPCIIQTPYALLQTDERLFPASRHRSKRIRKKLIKRFRGEFRQVPTMWQAGPFIYCHPSLIGELRAALEKYNGKPAGQDAGAYAW